MTNKTAMETKFEMTMTEAEARLLVEALGTLRARYLEDSENAMRSRDVAQGQSKDTLLHAAEVSQEDAAFCDETSEKINKLFMAAKGGR